MRGGLDTWKGEGKGGLVVPDPLADLVPHAQEGKAREGTEVCSGGSGKPRSRERGSQRCKPVIEGHAASKVDKADDEEDDEEDAAAADTAAC